MIWSTVEYVDESRALDANGLVCMDVWSRSFDLLYRKSDQLYHEIAVNCGISENAYWLMYVIYTCGGTAPMRELVERCCSPKQTVASSLRALEGKGYVKISFCEGSRKNKQVSFTETGREFARTQSCRRTSPSAGPSRPSSPSSAPRCCAWSRSTPRPSRRSLRT